jgi:murein DD-endopeptidase MepM/ murein hydrolase activator NlpD
VNGVWRDAQPFQMHLYRGHYHLGADYNRGGADMDRGRPVYPAAEGVVSRVIENECRWGNIIFVRHTMPFGDFTTMYAHVDWLETGPPWEGMHVRSDQPICSVGDGYWNNQECERQKEGCYPCHLHFELRLGDDTAVGLGYTRDRVEIGPQGQVDPNAFIVAH